MFIGEIVSIKGEESILTDISNYISSAKEIPDMIKANGIVYAVTGDHRYYCGLGEPLAKAHSIGRKLID